MKVEILIGMPGSGKTTYSRDQKLYAENNGNFDVKVFSSDEYRDRLRLSNPEMDGKTLNTLVFDTLTTDILVDIKNGQEDDLIIFDATNLNRRRRRFFYTLAKRKRPDCHVKAVIFFKTLAESKFINEHRTERTLPEDVLDKYYYNIQIPRIGADCDGIRGYNQFFFYAMLEEHPSLWELAHVSKESLKIEIGSILDNTLDHDCPPHHLETVAEHIEMCLGNSFSIPNLEEIALFHDLGKAITKKIGSDGRARYLGHANVSAYYYLNYILGNGYSPDDLKEKYRNAECIFQHMNGHQGMGEKNIKNNKIDHETVARIELFAKIDSVSRRIGE